MKFDPSVLVAIDYDGTLCNENDGQLDEVALFSVLEMKRAGAKLILWTCREGKLLNDALQKCSIAGLQFDYVNCGNGKRPDSRKVNADFYIDNRATIGKIDWAAWLNMVRQETMKR